MAVVRFTLNDGTVIDGNGSAPWTVREQIDWERHFKCSFATVFQAIGAEAGNIAARAREDADLSEIPAAHFRVEWLLWFAWHRLRPQVAGRFETFIDSQLADYDFLDPADEDAPAVEPGPAPDGSLDPTGTEPASTLAPSPAL
ncbi:hypothetical protein K6U06_06615 [Acidiferrimicrobium sp. IK]|uniref:hypothetical protein n=1 Tax=Acidiferrimicrobium sp. IK TaxID=2871700 RepID=UPI0021CB3600|nr:hypothetical protein [Acidiferrimicrobium sp. IK]MCU4184026.1 hypothetical protein [Acidiferrimicrobium sp. IK]